jgi:uncharacterized protein (TIGR02145 family)
MVKEDLSAINEGLCNLEKHIENVALFGVPVVVAINRFSTDTDKEIELVNWASPNFGATNSSGFSGLPGGCRDYDGTYLEIGNQGHWWSATQASTLDAYYLYLDFSNSNINRLNYFKSKINFHFAIS